MNAACQALVERAERINWEAPGAAAEAEDILAAWAVERRRGGDPEKVAIKRIVSAFHLKFPDEMIGEAIKTYLQAAEDQPEAGGNEQKEAETNEPIYPVLCRQRPRTIRGIRRRSASTSC
jgi:hypothetical protein